MLVVEGEGSERASADELVCGACARALARARARAGELHNRVRRRDSPGALPRRQPAYLTPRVQPGVPRSQSIIFDRESLV